jgi:hypothetical protein
MEKKSYKPFEPECELEAITAGTLRVDNRRMDPTITMQV